VLSEAARRDVGKFVRYALDRRSFRPRFDGPGISQQAVEAAAAARGAGRGPALLIHGILPRSGTVYVGELLRLHPDLQAYPHQVWEFPFLQQVPRVLELEEAFLWAYTQNRGKIGEQEFLPLFGAALMAYLHQAVLAGQRMLLKVPSVQHLDAFYQAFPHEHLLVLVRDGRDVVQSTLKTWPQLRFWMVCVRWRRAAEMVLACDRHYRLRATGYWLARYEDAVRDPEGFVREACQRFGLDAERYPFDQVGSVPVHGSSGHRREGKVAWAPVTKGADFSPVGRWEAWSSLKKWTFERLAGRALAALGYAGGESG
jgi:protein-tyrosine sulfotransferase